MNLPWTWLSMLFKMNSKMNGKLNFFIGITLGIIWDNFSKNRSGLCSGTLQSQDFGKISG